MESRFDVTFSNLMGRIGLLENTVAAAQIELRELYLAVDVLVSNAQIQTTQGNGHRNNGVTRKRLPDELSHGSRPGGAVGGRLEFSSSRRVEDSDMVYDEEKRPYYAGTDERAIFQGGASLFMLMEGTEKWKSRGTGHIEIVQAKENAKKIRIVMWRETEQKIGCIHWVTKDMQVFDTPKVPDQIMWTALDFAEAEDAPKPETFMCKFREEMEAKQFKAVMEKAIAFVDDAGGIGLRVIISKSKVQTKGFSTLHAKAAAGMLSSPWNIFGGQSKNKRAKQNPPASMGYSKKTDDPPPIPPRATAATTSGPVAGFSGNCLLEFGAGTPAYRILTPTLARRNARAEAVNKDEEMNREEQDQYVFLPPAPVEDGAARFSRLTTPSTTRKAAHIPAPLSTAPSPPVPRTRVHKIAAAVDTNSTGPSVTVTTSFAAKVNHFETRFASSSGISNQAVNHPTTQNPTNGTQASNRTVSLTSEEASIAGVTTSRPLVQGKRNEAATCMIVKKTTLTPAIDSKVNDVRDDSSSGQGAVSQAKEFKVPKEMAMALVTAGTRFKSDKQTPTMIKKIKETEIALFAGEAQAYFKKLGGDVKDHGRGVIRVFCDPDHNKTRVLFLGNDVDDDFFISHNIALGMKKIRGRSFAWECIGGTEEWPVTGQVKVTLPDEQSLVEFTDALIDSSEIANEAGK